MTADPVPVDPEPIDREPIDTLPAVEEPGLPSDQVTRSLHPLSLLFEIAHLVRTNLFPVVFASFSAASGGVIGTVIGCAIFAIALLVAIFRFITFRYTIAGGKLLIDQGLLYRQHRAVPIERIQNIDSVQNLFHRWLGVAEVRIETASGNEPEATLRVITVAEVDQLRAILASHASAVKSDETSSLSSSEPNPAVALRADPPLLEAPRETILELSTGRLFQAGLISNRGFVLASVVFGYFWQYDFRAGNWEDGDKAAFRGWLRDSIPTDQATYWLTHVGSGLMTVFVAVVVLLAIVVLLRLFSAAWYILKFHGYQLQLRGQDLVIQCGLFTKVSATVPRHRIQVVSVQRSWLARKFGLAAVRLETLGGSGKEDEDASTTVARRWFIPILAESELTHVLKALDPQLTWVTPDIPWQPLSQRAFARMIRVPLGICLLLLLVGIGIGVWVHSVTGAALVVLSLVLATLALLVARRQSRSRRFARLPYGFVYRSGMFTQKTSFGFWDRVQDIDLIQSPFDRRWQMASLRLDTAGAGTADHPLLVEYLDAEVAQREYRLAVGS